MSDLKSIGYSDWFKIRVDDKKIAAHGVARVVSVHKDSYTITLLNTIIGNDKFETKPVSKIQSKGRHTTTSRQLVRLESGAMIIDTPGMRELANISVDDGLDEAFSEILELSQYCKFNNCSHTNEKGCAILAAIKANDLSEQRYHNYLKMKKESDFNQMSYLEKRKKGKGFAKLVKSAIKNKQR